MASSKLTNEDKLKRLLYLNSYDGRYVSGDADKYTFDKPSTTEIVNELIKTSPNDIIKVVTAVNEDKLLHRRANLFYMLAAAINSPHTPEKLKSEIASTVLKVCKSDEEFFDFIKYSSKLRTGKSKLSNSVRKCVLKYYKNKSEEELARSFIKSSKYHSWSHKDMIKYAHVKSDTPLKNIVLSFILFRKANESDQNDEAKKIIDLFKKAEELKTTKEDSVAIPIIKELKASIPQVCTSLHKSPEVWNAILPHMPLSEILTLLPKLYKLGLLKANTQTQSKILDALTNAEKVKSSKIHPVEVYINLKTFEKGGKPLDPKLLEHLVKEKKMTEEDIKKITPNEPKCPTITGALQKCLNISYSNINSIGKRYMITIDVTERMDSPCLHNKNITSLEAAVAITMSLLRAEKDVTVATYNEKNIKIVNLDRNASFQDIVQKLQSNKSSYLVPSASIEWANNKKKHIDIFINILHKDFMYLAPKEINEKALRDKPAETLNRYRKKMNLQNAKLLTIIPSAHNYTLADGTPNAIDILGFDKNVPKIMESFCRGNFL